MSQSNGLFVALGAVAGIALAGIVQGQIHGSQSHDGACASCGGSMDKQVKQDKGAIDTHLVKQRYDARAGFFVPTSTIDALDLQYPSFRTHALSVARAALQHGLGGSSFARLEEAQRARLTAAGFGPREGQAFASALLPVRTIQDYALGKVADAGLDDSGERKVADPLGYAADLYAKRAWALHVCEVTGYLDPATRLAVYGKGAERTLFDGVAFDLVVAERPKLAPPRGARLPLVLPPKADATERMKGAPHLRMTWKGEHAGFYFLTDIGGLLAVNSTRRLPILTSTSKMSSPSFGLPAGSKKFGGTCSGADIVDPGGVERDRTCGICYATSASYGYANNMTQQEARKRWIHGLLREKNGSTVAGYMLACMVEAYARYTLDGKDRLGQEIGVWSGSEIEVPMGRGYAACYTTPLQVKSVGGVSIPPDTNALFRRRKITPGTVAGFFRIHDSGDFSLGEETGAYIDAWGLAAKLLPEVYFWAPTRVWATRKGKRALTMGEAAWVEQSRVAGEDAVSATQTYTTRAFVRVAGQAGSANGDIPGATDAENPADVPPGGIACSLAKDRINQVVVVPRADVVARLARVAKLRNFTMRPSGLYIKRAEGAPVSVPTIEGMVGSGVASQLKDDRGRKIKGRHDYPAMADTRGIRAWQCPVYTTQADGKEAKSCQAANCRACWVAKDLPIFYGAH